jgi:hypothetical protein
MPIQKTNNKTNNSNKKLNQRKIKKRRNEQILIEYDIII